VATPPPKPVVALSRIVVLVAVVLPSLVTRPMPVLPLMVQLVRMDVPCKTKSENSTAAVNTPTFELPLMAQLVSVVTQLELPKPGSVNTPLPMLPLMVQLVRVVVPQFARPPPLPPPKEVEPMGPAVLPLTEQLVRVALP
jgi:hypothetical protein